MLRHDSAEAALFAEMEQSLRPPPPLTPAQHLAKTMESSEDRRMQTLSVHAYDDAGEPSFLLTLLTTDDEAVLQLAATALWEASADSDTRNRIGSLGGLRYIVNLLFAEEREVQHAAAGCCTLLALEDHLRTEMIQLGAAGALTAMLDDVDPLVAAQAADALVQLAVGQRAALVEAGSAARLAGVLARPEAPPALLEAACNALAASTSCGGGGGNDSTADAAAASDAADAFARSGGVAPLVRLLRPHAAPTLPPALVASAARAARALATHSSAAARMLDAAGAVEALCSLLESCRGEGCADGGQGVNGSNDEAAAEAAAALGALALVPQLRERLGRSARCVATLARCLGRASSDALREASCGTLRLLARETSVQTLLADVPVVRDVVEALVGMMEGDEAPSMQQAAASLLGSLTLVPRGRRALLSHQALTPHTHLSAMPHYPCLSFPI